MASNSTTSWRRASRSSFSTTARWAMGKADGIDDALGRYLVFLKNCVPRSVNFESMRIAIDCANGAGYKVGPDVLEELGAEVVALGVDPNGVNINDRGGAVHLERIRRSE